MSPRGGRTELGVRVSDLKREPPAPGVCPVIDIDYRVDRPAFAHYASLNDVRELAPIVWNETPYGFWMVSRYDEVREALQSPDVFTNKVVTRSAIRTTTCT